MCLPSTIFTKDKKAIAQLLAPLRTSSSKNVISYSIF